MRSWRRALMLVVAAGWAAACSTSIGGQPAAVSNRPSSTVSGSSTSAPTNVITVPSSGPAARPGSTTPATTPPASTSANTATPAAHGAIGSSGIGDPYYPDSGNGGFQVDHYGITLTYDPAANTLSAATTVTGTVTQKNGLGRFNLDLQPTMRVSAVRVNGSVARFQQQQQAELVITPAAALAPGAALEVAVTYSGRPAEIAGGTAGMGDGGWYRTPSGGAIAIGEPFSGSSWYPVNEHPSDPATYQVTATVPAKWAVMSNGVATTAGLPSAPAGMKVFQWTQNHPITSYESTIYIDTFTTMTDTTVDGKPIVSAFAPSADVAKYKSLAKDTRRILQVLGSHFGPYPFDAAGGIYTGQSLSFALETATRPVYADWVDTDTIVHELTHQWFGDDVVIARWSDICLNECFASYGPWLWHQDVDGADLDAEWVDEMATAGRDGHFWGSPLVGMGVGNEFTSVYTRGPLAVHALRKQMGETRFAALLKGWPATYGGRAASWNDFVAYVNKVGGQDLTSFVNAWFRGTTVPAAQFLHPGGIGS